MQQVTVDAKNKQDASKKCGEEHGLQHRHRAQCGQRKRQDQVVEVL